jgi:predicted DNA-binding protein
MIRRESARFTLAARRGIGFPQNRVDSFLNRVYIIFYYGARESAMAKKAPKKIAAKDADQYMLRLPPGLRDRVAQRAAENGRSMNTEVIDAIEKHLKEADRVTQLWDLFRKHRQNIEDLDLIGAAVENLESAVSDLTNGEFYGRLSMLRKVAKERAREAGMPPITADQAATIRILLKDSGTSEAKFLDLMRTSSIEEIRDFERARRVLRDLRRDPQAGLQSPHRGPPK